MERPMTSFEDIIISTIGKLGRDIEEKKEERLEETGSLEVKVLTAEIEILSQVIIDLQFDMIANIYTSHE